MTKALGTRRIAAEALAAARPEPQAQALAVARRVDGPLEDKLLAYYENLPEAQDALAVVERLQRILFFVFAGGALLALVAGGATVRTAFGAEEGIIVNFHWVIASILGLNLLMLVAWLGSLVLARRHAGENGLGAAVLGLWRMGVERRSDSNSLGAQVGKALILRIARARLWIASALSHGLWLAFLVGGFAMALMLLSTQQYVFVWETTILSADSYIAITKALSALPQLLGFAVPGDVAIRAAQWQGTNVAPSGGEVLWSTLLLACILLYGILPRAFLLAVSAAKARRTGWRAPLDPSRPEFAALVPHLAPVVERTRIVSPAPASAAGERSFRHPALRELPAPGGRVAVLGWETDIDLPALNEEGLINLGNIDGSAALEDALRTLANGEAPARILVVADLCITPDRGVTAGLRRIRTAHADVVLLLTGQAALRARLDDAAAHDRLTDWVRAAHAAGIALDHIVEMDLTALSAEEADHLHHLTGQAA